VDDPNLKGRIVELKRMRDAARADADRAESRADDKGKQLTPELLSRFGIEAVLLRTKDPSLHAQAERYGAPV
jgi:hypothetical protein